MPIYEYECLRCGHQFEMLVLKNTVAACPECKSKKLEQLLSAFAVASEEKTRANVADARRRYKTSSTYVEKQKAEAEEIIEHTPSLQDKPKPGRKVVAARSSGRKK